MKQRQRFNRFWPVIVLTVVLMVATALIVYADSIVNRIDNTIDETLETRTITAGGSTVVGFYIEQSNDVPSGDLNGCNAGPNDHVSVTLSVPSVVSASSTTLKFDGCGASKSINVTFSSNTPGSYTISVASVTDGKPGSLWDTAPAAFTLVVNPPADATPPVITSNVSGTPGNNGWYRSDVTVSWSVSDPESAFTTSGCDTSYVTSDTAGQTFTCTATSAGGTSSQSVTIKRDATPPTISGAAAPAPVGGWNNTDVAVSFTCADNLSGVASCGPNVTLSSEGAGQSATGTAVDNAGNSASATVSGINIDKTAPVITPTVIGTPGNNGWYTSDVAVSWSYTDISPVTASGCESTTISADTTGTTLTCTATSAGGTSSQSVTIKRDATPPTISGSRSPGANSYGWNNTDVTVSFTCNDGTSGVASCTGDTTLTGEGAGQLVTGTAVDNAGNSASATVSDINIDKTAPTISGSRSPDANSYGWNNTDVTVSFSCADALSGVDTCTAPVTLGEGANQSVTGNVTDRAGNSASATVSNINIDKTAPTISAAPTTSPNSNGWYNTNVTIHFTCSDALSGIDSCPADITLGAIEGNNLGASGTAYDKAGNSASASVSGINIDKTAPSATASASPAANANGWNNTDVTVSFSGTDSLSGIDFCDEDVVLSDEGENQSASGTCTDKAGNVSAQATVSGINIDKTAPLVTVTGVADGATYILGAVPAAGCSTTDALSGVAVKASLESSYPGGVGTFTATCSGALDNAGNAGSASVTYRVIYNFNGFFRPVDNPPVVNRVKAGSAIPVKFSLSGYQGMSIFAAGSPSSAAISCGGLTVIDPVEETVTAGNSSLNYDPLADQYIYVWKTSRDWGGTCRQLTVTLVDGTSHVAYFNFTR